MKELDPLQQCILNECFSEREIVGGLEMWAPTKYRVGIDIPPSHVDHGTRGQMGGNWLVYFDKICHSLEGFDGNIPP